MEKNEKQESARPSGVYCNRVRAFAWRFRGPLAAAVVCIAAVTGLFDLAYDRHVGGPLQEHNQAYLEEASEKATQLLIPLAVVKGTVDILEGSTAVGIEFGDIVQPLLDYVNMAFRVVVIAAVALTVLKHTLGMLSELGPFFLTAGTAAYLVFAVVRMFTSPAHPVRVGAKRFAGMCILVACLVYFILPVSIYCAAAASAHTTAPIEEDYQKALHTVRREFSLETIVRADTLVDKAKAMQKRGARIANYAVGHGVRTMSRIAIKIAVVYLLEGIVFPLGAFLFLVWFVRSVMVPALGLREPGISSKEVAALLARMKKEEAGGAPDVPAEAARPQPA